MSEPIKVYISGPISGMPNGNTEAFGKRAVELARMGFIPINPWDINPDDHLGPCIGREVEHTVKHRYGCFLRADIRVLMECNAFTMLDKWGQSVGARVERDVARALGLPEIVVL